MQSHNLSPKKKLLENKVLEISKKHNPSHLRFEQKNFARQYEKQLFDFYQNRIKYPIKLFQNSNVLDIGSGTGEKGIFYSKWGANLTCIDFNLDAIKQHKELIKKFGVNPTKTAFHNVSIYQFDNPENIEFDLTISFGVLPHVADPKKAFKKQIEFLKKGGFTLVSVLNSAGNFHMNLQRFCLYKLSKYFNMKIENLAEILFKEYIDRAEKFGGRLRDSIISDNYCNPKVTSFSTSEILSWFRSNNIKFYSSWPPIFPDFIADSFSRKYVPYTEMKKTHFISKFESNWVTSTKNDSDKIKTQNQIFEKFDNEFQGLCSSLQNVEPDNLKNIDSIFILEKLDNMKTQIKQVKEFDNWIQNMNLFAFEVKDLIKTINSKNIKLSEIQNKIKNYKILFSKNAGISTTFYMGYK